MRLGPVRRGRCTGGAESDHGPSCMYVMKALFLPSRSPVRLPAMLAGAGWLDANGGYGAWRGAAACGCPRPPSKNISGPGMLGQYAAAVIRCGQTWIAGSDDLQPDRCARGSVGPLAIFRRLWSAVSNPASSASATVSHQRHQLSAEVCRCWLSLALPAA